MKLAVISLNDSAKADRADDEPWLNPSSSPSGMVGGLRSSINLGLGLRMRGEVSGLRLGLPTAL